MPKEIILSGHIGLDITANGLRSDLEAANGGDVLILANGPGGLAFEAIEMFNMIREYNGHVEFRITGIAASAMSYLAMAANKVTAYDNAAFMIHNAINFVFGNHHDMRAAADRMEGISNILAKAYANKSVNSLAETKKDMDNEAFYFGDEILKEGFADEIIEAPDDSDNDGDRATAILTTKASVEMCKDKLRGSEAANNDYEKAVAYLDKMSLLLDAQGNVNTQKEPAGAGPKTLEVKYMTLAELLAANPSVQAEFDGVIATARTEGTTAAKDEMTKVIAKVSPILASVDYSETVKSHGIKAITGEGAMATFDALVAMADQEKETTAAAAAAAEQGEETPAAGGGDATEAEAAAKFDDKKKRLKQGV